ncbi:MAG: hypothetical protein HS117_02695 [Verrucomicrobiaceae bacterium]|nr:hypothetical protein [Verrucomicrobiaceae bacterium]
MSRTLLVNFKVHPKTISLEKRFSRDVSDIGHFGTGDLELIVRTSEDLEKAKTLILKSGEVDSGIDHRQPMRAA